MMLSKIMLAVASLWLTLASPTLATVHEQLASVPTGWTQIGTPADTDILVLQIGLQESNLDQLESMIYAVSTPGSSSYGNYMDGDAVAAMLQPSIDANSAVLDWLKGAGVTDVDSDGTWLNFSTSVGTANSLLSTTFNYYENNGIQKLRTTQYSIPDDLADHIDLITPTTYFGKTTAQAPVPKMHYPQILPRQTNSTNGTNSSCAALITPACIKQLYNISYAPDPASGSKIAFGSFLNESARTDDLSAFETMQDIPQQGFSVQLINGGVNDQAIDANHGEANLDVEYIVGVSHPLPIISYITGGSP